MKSSPRRVVFAIADALFERDGEKLNALADAVLAFVAAASFTTRVLLHAGLFLLRFAPIFLVASLRPLDRIDRDRRRAILERVERTPIGLALVGWRTLLMLHFYEDAAELARIGYREERKRHLAVIPVPATSGVRLREDLEHEHEGEHDEEHGDVEKKGAA
jgi:hypothetical protein